MNMPEFTHKKRAIYTGLKPFLDEIQLMEAIILWETKYAQTPTFSVRYFVADLVREIDPSLTTKQLLVHLVSTLALPENELYPDPSASVKAYQQGKKVRETKIWTPPEVSAMQSLINAWLQIIPPGPSVDIVRFVSRNLAELEIETDLKHKVVDWLANREKTIRLKQVSLTELRKIINLFYIAVCEYLGPMTADTSLAKATNRLRHNGNRVREDILGKIL